MSRIIYGNQERDINFNYVKDNVKEELLTLDYESRLVILHPLIKGSIAEILKKQYSDQIVYDMACTISDNIINIFRNINRASNTKRKKLSIDMIISIISNELLAAKAGVRDDLSELYEDIKILANSISIML